MREHGFELSIPASTPRNTILFTAQPYAAATFAEHATPAARAQLGWIIDEIAKSRAPASGSHYDVPNGLELWDFQIADLDYMLSRERVLDADEPGLGKTATAIVYGNTIQAQRILVICPASIRLQWLGQIAKWSTMGESYKVPNTFAHAVTKGKNGVHPSAAWTVVSYELARSPGILAALRQTHYDLLILDEAHFLKTSDARRTRAVFGGGLDPLYHEALCEAATRVVALTGTPLPNRPREAYTLGRHLCHEAFDWLSEARFYERFNPINYKEVTRKDGTKVRISDERSGRHAELQNRLRANFMCRHLKREVLTSLKYPVFDLVRVEETTAVKAALKAESLLGIDPEHLEGADAQVFGHIAEARRIMGEAMAPQVADFVATLLAGGEEKITLFYWHISVGTILMAALARFGAVKVDGSTSPLQKEALIGKFRADPECRVIMGNILSLGTGTDGLQDVCWHAVLAEPDWTLGSNVQCFDRLDRGGQRNLVLGDVMVAPNSLSEKVLATALRKGRVVHNSLDRQI
jgi:SWI/SNF-related matrix-associated actin-dependent regulator of chromatin subfamily A-like protein 1